MFGRKRGAERAMEEKIVRRLRRTGSVVICAAVAALVVAAPSGASRLQADMSVPVGSQVKLVNHVYLVVPVVITCPVITLNPDEIIQGENVDVRVTEKVGGSTIVSGEGSIGYDDGRIFGGGVSGTLLTCDGQPHTYPVTVFPAINDNSGNGTGVAFKGGKAVAQASFEILLRDKVTFAFDDNAVGSGLTSVNIRG